MRRRLLTHRASARSCRRSPAARRSELADAGAVLSAIAQAYEAQTGVHLVPEADALAEGMQEDFVILHDESDGGWRHHACALSCRCAFPSNWDPAEKLGLDFAAIHAPVADNALLQAGARGIIDMAFRQAPMLRHVWLLTSGGDLAQHPETRRTRWDDAVAAADAAERPA